MEGLERNVQVESLRPVKPNSALEVPPDDYLLSTLTSTLYCYMQELIPNGCEGLLETNMDLLRIIIAILLPPLGVFLQVGLGGAFWLNILLTLLGYIPGIVHAVWIIAKR